MRSRDPKIKTPRRYAPAARNQSTSYEVIPVWWSVGWLFKLVANANFFYFLVKILDSHHQVIIHIWISLFDKTIDMMVSLTFCHLDNKNINGKSILMKWQIEYRLVTPKENINGNGQINCSKVKSEETTFSYLDIEGCWGIWNSSLEIWIKYRLWKCKWNTVVNCLRIA